MEVTICPVLLRIVVGQTLFCHHGVKFQPLVGLLNLEKQ
jgi:hypothetical protein